MIEEEIKKQIKEYIKNQGDIKVLFDKYPDKLTLISETLIEVINEENDSFDKQYGLKKKENSYENKQ